MKKNKNMVIGFALFFLAALVGEAYCLLNFAGDYITIAGVGAVLLIAAYLLMDAAFAYSKEEKENRNPDAADLVFGQPDWIEKKKAEQEQEESEADKLQKGMYVIQKRLLGVLEEDSEARQEQADRLMGFLNRELTELIKAEIKYERENTKQVIANNKKKLEQVSSVLTQMSHERERELRDIRDSIQDMKIEKASVEVMLKEYQMSVDKVQQQLTTVTDLLRHVDNCTAELARRPVQVYSEPVRTAAVQAVAPEALVAEPVVPTPAPVVTPIVTDSVPPAPAVAEPDVPTPMTFEPAETDPLELVAESELEAFMPADEMESELEAFMPADEMESELEAFMPADEMESELEAFMPADEMEPELEAFMPADEMESEAEEEMTEDFTDFEMPELSALLDEAEEEAEDFSDFVMPEEETEPEPEPIPTPSPAADSNKMLSPDEIAALFASTSAPASEPIPVPEIEPEPMGEIMVDLEPIPEPAPIPTPAPSADSNKMLSPDEIAALFASTSAPASEPVPVPEIEPEPMGEIMVDPEPIPVPEPIPTPAPAADSNKMMSPDEIAALIASMGQ